MTLGIRIRNIFLNLFLLSVSIYVPLVLFSLYDYLRPNNSERVTNERVRKEDFPQKLSALNFGYKPFYVPSHLLLDINNPFIYPIGSLPLTKTYYCNEGYGLITYKTDRFGLRNLNEKWNKVNIVSNIFVIGDSFVHGACVPNDSTISSNLEKSLKINTINLGSSNNGPYEYQAILKSMVSPIINKSKNKNWVVLAFYPNDNQPINNNKEKMIRSVNSIVKITSKEGISAANYYKKAIRDIIKINYPESREEIKTKTFSMYDQFKWKGTFLYQTLGLVGIRDKVKYLLSYSPKKINTLNNNIEESSPSFSAVSILSEVCRDQCTPIILYIPKKFGGSLSQQYKYQLKEISKRMNIKFIDGEKSVDKNLISNYAPKGGHLSIEGYKKIADMVRKEIRD